MIMIADMIIHGVVIVLLLVSLALQWRRKGKLAELEKVVRMKKLQVSEKLLDQQLSGESDLMSMLQQGAQNKQHQEQVEQQQEDQENRTPVGFKQ
jgi:hypothetical protein